MGRILTAEAHEFITRVRRIWKSGNTDSLLISALLCLLFLVCVFVPAHAQQDWYDPSFNVPHAGVYGRAVANVHWADFPSTQAGMPSAACCPGFKSGFGWGWTVGALMRFPIPSEAPFMQASWAKERFSVALRADWTNHSGTLRTTTDSVVPNGNKTSINHELTTALFSLGGEALLQYRIAPRFQATFGIRIGAFYRKLYTQTRTFDDASGLHWANGFASDTLARDALIPNVTALSLDAAVVVGIQWDIPLTPHGDVLFSPELMYASPLSDIVPNRGWAHSRLQAGVALKFALMPSTQEPTASVISATTMPIVLAPAKQGAVQTTSQQVQPAELAAVRVEALVRDSTGRTLPAVQIRVEEFLSRRVVPLLISVFFEEHSATIPDRYIKPSTQDAVTFREENLAHKTTLEVYYDVLNIIGRRMSLKPAATLTLTGCLGEIGMNPASEENDSALAMRRAESVRNYLRDTWGIATQRCILKARGLPAQPSLTADAMAKQLNTDAEENRRVEIESDDWNIIKPVAQQDTLRVASYPEVLFKPSVSLQQVSSWELLVRQGAKENTRDGAMESLKTLAEFRAGGVPPNEISWNVTGESSPRSGARVVAAFTATEVTGKRATGTDSIDVQYISVQQKRNERSGDKELSRFWLINFDYGSPDHTLHHRQVTDEFIRPMVRDDSSVLIVGHTDALGNPASNARLSQSRAQAISQLLGKGKRTVQGLGGKDLLYPNDTPEGRFYCRAVEIVVETPVK